MKKQLVLLVLMIAFGLNLKAQEDGGGPDKKRSPNYPKLEIKQRTVVPYAPLREADVAYVRRVERVIDTREKKNQVMNWPQSPLNKVLYNLVTTGEMTGTGKLKAYKSDSLTNAMTVAEVKKIGAVTETIEERDTTNPDIYARIERTISTDFDYTQIKRWQITEEWIFDKQRSMYFPRIIAIAPLYQPSLNGVLFPEQPMFYISYADARPLLVNEEAFIRGNDGGRLSYYDYFEQRMFSSYITKESNDKDLAIKDCPEFKNAPIDALYESARVKAEMESWEQDLWEQ